MVPTLGFPLEEFVHFGAFPLVAIVSGGVATESRVLGLTGML